MQIPKNAKFPVLENEMAHIWRLPGGNICMSIKHDCMVDEHSAGATNHLIRELAGDRLARPILTDISSRHTTDASARKYGASKESEDVTWRLALLVRSSVSRMLGNAFLSTRRPPFPTRLFSEEEDGLQWLREEWTHG